MPKLIGLTGYSNSGKDTVASILSMEPAFKTFAFSDPMYAMLARIWKTDVETVHLMKRVEESSELIRDRLQALGQAARDYLGTDIWIRYAQQRYSELRLTNPGAVPVITDVRYPDEERWLRLAGGELWWIERPGTGPVNEHQSESHYSWLKKQADRTIHNNGSIDDLHLVIHETAIRY